MKKASTLVVILVVAVGAFVGGAVVSWRASQKAQPGQVARKVLYWVNPMHPSYKSDKPGIAPDCGMQLEPVYADDVAAGASGAEQPAVPGAFRVSDEKRQMIGVRIGTVDSQPVESTVRTVGRVAVDETRLYRVIAPVDGTIRQLSGFSTGSLVRNDDLLLSFLPRDQEYLRAISVYYYALDVERGAVKTGLPEGQARTGLQTARDGLVRLGMSETQMANLAKTRQPAADIEVRAPVTGYVVRRGVSPQQPMDRGAELYTIAELSRVWILVDVFEAENFDLKPGTQVRLSRAAAGSRPIEARVGDALPQFDPASRTMTIRLEADNRDHALRPGMFVDAEIPISLPAALTVPADAVVDSGVRRVVYVDRGGGYLEPRRVETGRRLDDRVEIVEGLRPGERIVLSGTFLLDSESRMNAPKTPAMDSAPAGTGTVPASTGTSAAGMGTATTAMGAAAGGVDPVCGMKVDQAKARAAGRVATYGGKTYVFCSDTCKRTFEQNPEKYGSAK